MSDNKGEAMEVDQKEVTTPKPMEEKKEKSEIFGGGGGEGSLSMSGGDLSGPRFSLGVTMEVSTSRMKNGLRHALYQRYRHYCSRRLLRLRKNLNVKQLPPSSAKSAPRRFVRVPISIEQVKDSRYFLIPLFEAERSWSYGMELREEYEQSSHAHRIRHHAITRFKRAASAAQHLLLLCQAVGDGRTKLEAEAYYLMLRGTFLMERKDYAQALSCFPQSHMIYEQLSHIVVDGDERKAIQTFLSQLDTSIKFCQFNRHLSRSATDGEEEEEEEEEEEGEGEREKKKKSESASKEDDLREKLEQLMLEESSKGGEAVTEVKWKNEMVPLPVGRVRTGFAEVKSCLDEIRKEKEISAALSKYDQLVTTYNDVTDIIRDQLNQLEKGGAKSIKTTSRQRHMKMLDEYVRFHRHFHLFNRNLLLLHAARIRYHHPEVPFGSFEVAERFSSSAWDAYCGVSNGQIGKKIFPEEVGRMCDNVLGNLKDLEESRDIEEVEEGKRFAALTLFFTSLRCYYVSLSFLRNHQYQESLALSLRTRQHASSAVDHFSVCSVKSKNEIASLESLISQIEILRCLIRAKYIVHTREKEEKEKGEKGKEEEKGGGEAREGEKNKEILPQSINPTFSLFSFTDTNEERVLLFPPDFQPVHCNPLLFDLAIDEVRPPSLEGRKAPARRGLFSWWR